jgi:hypothetical protein
MANNKHSSNLRSGSFAIDPLEKSLTQDLCEINLKQVGGGYMPICPELPPLQIPIHKELRKIQELLQGQ